MTSRCDGRNAPFGGGFTLIEMLVVLVVLSVSLILVIGYRPPWSKRFDIEATAAELAAQLRLVRSEAIAGNRPAALQLDLVDHQYRAAAGPARPLPPGLSVTLLTVAGERKTASRGDIRFNSDGSSTGGRIILADGTQRVAIGVDWLTGRISVADVR